MSSNTDQTRVAPPQLLFDDGSRAIQQTTATVATAAQHHDQTTQTARSSTISIATYYEIDRLTSEIIAIVQKQKQSQTAAADGWFARVALQLPDELLSDAPDVCWSMEEALLEKQQGTDSSEQQPSLVFCLGDTTFGPCCPDEVAALHLQANVLVHYGHACLSHPALQLPVLYGFGRTEHWDTEVAVKTILKQAQETEGSSTRRLLLLYQVRYAHAMEDLQTQLSERGDMLVVVGQVPVQDEPLEAATEDNKPSTGNSSGCCEGNQDCASNSITDNDNHTDKGKIEQSAATDPPLIGDQTTTKEDNNGVHVPPESKHCLLGGLEVPKALDFSTFVIVFVGDQATSSDDNAATTQEGQRQYMNTVLWYLSRNDDAKRPLDLWTYSPLAQTLTTSIPPTLQRQLNRRFYLIQKARDASVFGILIGTLSQRYFRSVVQTLRHVIEKQNHRSTYTFAMGKVNPAKIANFAEIDCFVMVACAETSWLDDAEQREMHVPIITPLELHMALGSGGPDVQWGECDYSLNYNDFLLKYPGVMNSSDDANSQQEEDEDDDDAPYFSMITGKYESKRKGNINDGVDLNALPGKGQLITYKSEAAEFLKQREYKGLETNLGETEVRAAVPGQKGIASKYNANTGGNDTS